MMKKRLLILALGCLVASVGCASNEPDDVPEGSEFLGTADDAQSLEDLPEDRIVAHTSSGNLYLLPQSEGPVGTDAAGAEGEATISDDAAEEEPASTDVRTVRQAIAAPASVLESIKGDDGRTAWHSATPSTYQQRAVHFEGTAHCSGSYIGPRHILTAAHCVYARGFAQPWFVPNNVYPARQGHPSASWVAAWRASKGYAELPYGAKATNSALIPTAYINTGESKYDQAVIILQDSASWGTWFAVSSAEPPLVNYHMGYPAATSPCKNSPGPAGSAPWDAPYNKSCGGLLYLGTSNNSSVTSDLIYSWHDTVGGQSGGPVFSQNTVYGTLVGGLTSGDRLSVFARARGSLYCDAFNQFKSTQYPHACN